MSDETTPAADDPERPATQEEMLAMLEELRELWWQVEKDRRRVRAGEITRLEATDGRSALDHPAHGSVPELDGKAEAALQRGQIEVEVGRRLPSQHQHLGSLTDAGGQGAHDDLVGACRFEMFGSDLYGSRG